jgi:hypothetical protein
MLSVSTAANPDPEAVAPAIFEAHESGRVAMAVNAAPAPAENTASIELIGTTEGAATAKPEALEPRAEGMAWRVSDTAPREGSTEGKGVLEALLL